MFWSYDTLTYSHYRPYIVLPDFPHVKHFNAVYSVKTKIKANLSRKHWLNYWHRCKHRCKRCLMHGLDGLLLNFNHTAVYAYIMNACDGPKIRMCAKSDNRELTTDLMVICKYEC